MRKKYEDLTHYCRWRRMIGRCYDKKDKAYKNYGGRGITVCDEWRKDYQKFYEWVYKSGYKEGLTLDRINNDKGYYPENCKWSNRNEQQNNRRTNHKITINGITMNLFEWVKISGIDARTITTRIERGWKNNDLLKKPTTSSKKIKQFSKDGRLIKEWISISEASRQLKIKVPSICASLKEKTKTCGGYIWKYSNKIKD